MEELLELLLPLAVIVISFVARSVKSKQAVQAHKAASAAFDAQLRQEEIKYEKPLRPAVPAAAAKMEMQTPSASVETHQHEGNQDAPCPATERRPSERVQETSAAAIPGLKINFDRNTVLQGFVMSEILNRPRPGARR